VALLRLPGVGARAKPDCIWAMTGIREAIQVDAIASWRAASRFVERAL